MIDLLLTLPFNLPDFTDISVKINPQEQEELVESENGRENIY
jgi:hypothetical protein